MGGSHTPAIGFAAGIERLILALEDNIKMPAPDVFIVSLGEQSLKYSLQIACSLREKNNLSVFQETLRRSLKSQLKEANKINAKYAIIIGEDEIKNQNATIKNMETGEQKNIAFSEINSFFA